MRDEVSERNEPQSCRDLSHCLLLFNWIIVVFVPSGLGKQKQYNLERSKVIAWSRKPTDSSSGTNNYSKFTCINDSQSTCHSQLRSFSCILAPCCNQARRNNRQLWLWVTHVTGTAPGSSDAASHPLRLLSSATKVRLQRQPTKRSVKLVPVLRY